MTYIFGIHPDHSGFYPLRETVGAANVSRPEVSGESVAAVVGDPQRFGVICKGNDCEDRAEDLFLGNAHLAVRFREESRLNVVSPSTLGAFAATADRRAFSTSQSGIAQYFLGLPRMDERANFGRRIQRMADLDARNSVGERLREAIVNGGLDKRPARRCAALAIEAVNHE